MRTSVNTNPTVRMEDCLYEDEDEYEYYTESEDEADGGDEEEEDDDETIKNVPIRSNRYCTSPHLLLNHRLIHTYTIQSFMSFSLLILGTDKSATKISIPKCELFLAVIGGQLLKVVVVGGEVGGTADQL